MGFNTYPSNPFPPSTDRIEAVERGKYQEIARVTGDGVKTASQLLEEMRSNLSNITLSKCAILYNNSAFTLMKVSSSHIIFSTLVNQSGDFTMSSFDIKANTAFWNEVTITTAGVVSATDHSSDVIPNGNAFVLVV